MKRLGRYNNGSFSGLEFKACDPRSLTSVENSTIDMWLRSYWSWFPFYLSAMEFFSFYPQYLIVWGSTPVFCSLYSYNIINILTYQMHRWRDNQSNYLFTFEFLKPQSPKSMQRLTQSGIDSRIEHCPEASLQLLSTIIGSYSGFQTSNETGNPKYISVGRVIVANWNYNLSTEVIPAMALVSHNEKEQLVGWHIYLQE